MLKTRKISSVMTSYAKMADKYHHLCEVYGPQHVKTKVCAPIFWAIGEELKRYCKQTVKPFDVVQRYACEVDLTCRWPKVTVYPYVYDDDGTYHILDGLYTKHHERYKDEKEQ